LKAHKPNTEGQLQLSTIWIYRKPLPLALLPALAGVLAWASFPKLNQDFLAWVALVPLLLYLIRIQKTSSAFLGGLTAGMVQFLALLYWVPRVLILYGGLPGPAAWGLFVLMVAILGCYPATVCALTRYCMNRGGTGFLLVFAPAWITLEYVRSRFPFGGFPWLLLGYSQTNSLRLLQVADLAGVYGISFLVAWVNTALVWAWLHRGYGWRACGPIVSAGVLLTACLAYGSAELRRWDQVQPQYRAALLQGNLSVDKPEPALAEKYKKGYVRMADRLGSAHADLLILPESPSPIIFQYDREYRETMQDLAHRFPLGVVFNNIRFRDGNEAGRYFNSAFFLDRSGTEIGVYDKIHLVPFGEYIPCKKLFFFSETISKDIGDFQPGDTYLTVPLRGHAVNAIICFEAVFPDLCREFVRRGSELIINLTNDGWYGNTSAPYQHLAMARWRAVETRRYLLRAANSGITAVIGPTGRIQVQTALFQEETAIGRFSFLTGQTFYARHGSSLLILCVIILFGALFWSLLKGARSR
jgi:apolipoprotein N-acyltransferase